MPHLPRWPSQRCHSAASSSRYIVTRGWDDNQVKCCLRYCKRKTSLTKFKKQIISCEIIFRKKNGLNVVKCSVWDVKNAEQDHLKIRIILFHDVFCLVNFLSLNFNKLRHLSQPGIKSAPCTKLCFVQWAWTLGYWETVASLRHRFCWRFNVANAKLLTFVRDICNSPAQCYEGYQTLPVP